MTAIQIALLTAVVGWEPKLDFAHEVAPLLKRRCGECHAGPNKKGGLSINTRESLLKGGENGPVVIAKQSAKSRMIELIASKDDSERMPPEGERLSPKEVDLLRRWIDADLPWDEGFTFAPPRYEPPLKPRRPTLPPAIQGRDNPIDRILDHELSQRNLPRPKPVDAERFVRRAYLDLIGLLPTVNEIDQGTEKFATRRIQSFIESLLSRDADYAEHWLTFWNDLLRNDYGGTGFITGGRKQISKWLYESLVTNKPFDQFARELIAPPNIGSQGFGDGIKWRGEVSAGQTVEIQFAQSVGQAFLGINLKCASCHDSFVDRWKLDESYGLAAIYADRPLEIHRCDKPVGKAASPGWLFPEIGQVSAEAPRQERLQQLADLLTSPQNGRFARTIVNRLWHRLMGRGIVHPVDAMQTEPWSADLLDFLADDFVEHKYDLKHTLRLIATSQAYKSESAIVKDGAALPPIHAAPKAKRLTAEQFIDAVWQLTGAGPTKFDAPVVRGSNAIYPTADKLIIGQKVRPTTETERKNQKLTAVRFHQAIQIPDAVTDAAVVILAAKPGHLVINGRAVGVDEWATPLDLIAGKDRIRTGANTIDVILDAAEPTEQTLYVQLLVRLKDGAQKRWATDDQWQCTIDPKSTKPRPLTAAKEVHWQPTTVTEFAEATSEPAMTMALLAMVRLGLNQKLPPRSALSKSDFLARTLGRPNRDQIVSQRPTDLSTLEAIDLTNGPVLAEWISQGAKQWLYLQHPDRAERCPEELFRFALSRRPTAEELTVLRETVGSPLTAAGVEDMLWMLIMHPEFQMVR